MIIKGLKKFAGFTACVIVLSGCSAGTKDGTKEASDGGLSATSDGVSSSSVDTGSMERDGSPESVKVVLNGQAQEPISAPVTCQLEDDDTAGGTERVVIISQLVEAENRNGWKGWQVVVNDGDPPSLKGLLAAGYPGMDPYGYNFASKEGHLRVSGKTYTASDLRNDGTELEITATCP